MMRQEEHTERIYTREKVEAGCRSITLPMVIVGRLEMNL
jgi:hypothetical protein